MRDMTGAIAPGTRLYRACEILVRNAPAKMIVNDVTIIARSGNTKVDDIYKQYWLNLWRKHPTPENWDNYERAC
jgi:hypothetical protein